MDGATDISRIYEELTVRYNRISISTIKGVITGKIKVKSSKVEFKSDSSMPSLAEAETAFRKYNCAIFTAFRGGYSLEENLNRNKRLKDDMTRMGMQFRPVNGCYREAGWEYTNVEYCFFVTEVDSARNFDFFKQSYELAAKYDQDSFLYKRAGINRYAFLVATTDAGRVDLQGDIKFAGQLFIDVHDIDAWTDCSDGRFSFVLKGMVLIGTENKKLKLGEGDLFDTESYGAKGLVVLRSVELEELGEACKNYDGVPLVEHVFQKDPSPERLHDVVFSCLKKLRDQKIKKIGFHCSVRINGSWEEGAAVAYQEIHNWAKRFDKKFDKIVIVDTYGDYSKVLNKARKNK